MIGNLGSQKKRRGKKGALKGDTAGTAGIVEINYFGGRLNLKTYWLVIDLAGGVAQIWVLNFKPEINLARAIMVGSDAGSFG
jgi:hypothetical protein